MFVNGNIKRKMKMSDRIVLGFIVAGWLAVITLVLTGAA
jgi:hypothetical protein